MAETKPYEGFQKGNTIAKDNNNQAKKRIRRSKLRQTLLKLQALEPKALENIEKSIHSESIDKESLNTSRWLIQQLQSVAKAASAEELEQNNLRWKASQLAREDEEDEDAQQEEEESPRAKFSLYHLPTKDDLKA